MSAKQSIDNAHIAQSRLILLDATLIFFLTLTIYCYIKFQKLRYWYVIHFYACSCYLTILGNSRGSGGSGFS